MLAEVEPALDDAIDQPKRDCQQDALADQQDQGRETNHSPDQGDPEGSDLPAEMAFDPTPLRVFPAYVVDDDAGEKGHPTGEKGCGLEAVDDHCQSPETGFGGGFCLLLPDVVHVPQYTESIGQAPVPGAIEKVFVFPGDCRYNVYRADQHSGNPF